MADPQVIEVGTDVASVDLDTDLQYTVYHDSEDVSGTEDLNVIYLGYGQAAVASPASGNNKAKLLPGRALLVGPGVSSLSYICSTGGPTMTLIPDNSIND